MSTDHYSPSLKAIADRIKEIRKKAGYGGYKKFALAHDFEPKQYWRLESGQNFEMVTLLRILKIHKISLKEFFDGVNEQ